MSTVVLRGWMLDGGSVAISGLVVDNVTIAVDRSRIWAKDGPAVGIDVSSASDVAPVNISVTGLRLTARNSDLRSTGNASATVLGVTVASSNHLFGKERVSFRDGARCGARQHVSQGDLHE